ncbi:24940_t:CDS:2, partial [Racocetra persica]
MKVHGEIKSNNDLRFENDIEGELGFEREKDTEDRPAIECEKDTEDGPSIEPEDGPGIELEEDIDIISKSDDTSKNTDNYQHGHLSPIFIEIYYEKTFETWKECQKTLKRYACQNNFSKGPDNKTIIKLILMHSEHNHQLIPENVSFATSYQKLTTDMKEFIESYTICDIDVSSQQTIEATGVQPGAFMIDADPGLEKEQFAGRFAAWHKKTASYMTPSLHTDQINEAVMYHSKKVSFEDPYNLTLEVVDNGLIEFEYDFSQIWFDKLLEGVDYSLVAEVWD